MNNNPQTNILYSCVSEQKRDNEQVVVEHALGIILSGESHFYTSQGTRTYGEGTIGLIKKNTLLKTVKVPSHEGKPFKSINVFLDQETLRRYSAENNIHARGSYTGEPMIVLSPDPIVEGYFDSLLPYFDYPRQLTRALAELKTKEAIELLLRFNSLRDFLFDFSQPFKIDLEAFMNKNFMFNVPLDRFAKLTGRSLATFKRDFKEIFSTPPEKWLRQKRLEKAHFLIAQGKQSPATVYHEVGFENLSHFSYAFKEFFGYNPSSL